MSYVDYEDACRLAGSADRLLKKLRLGTVTAEGRYFDIESRGEDDEGDDYSAIPSFNWQDCNYTPENESLFHPEHHHGFRAIRFKKAQFDSKALGGRPEIFDKERLFAEIAAYFMVARPTPDLHDKTALRKTLQTELPYLRAFDEEEKDDAIRSSYSEKTLRRAIDSFCGHYNRAIAQFDKDAES